MLLLLSNSFIETKLTKVRLSEVTHSIFYAPLYVAINNGYFEQEGISIELTNGGGADKVMTAILSGDAEIGLMGPEATIYVTEGGTKDKPVVFGQLTKRDGSFIVSKQNIDNFTMSDLKGKTIIGGRKGGVPAMTLQYTIEKAGLEIGLGDNKVNIRMIAQGSDEINIIIGVENERYNKAIEVIYEAFNLKSIISKLQKKKLQKNVIGLKPKMQ